MYIKLNGPQLAATPELNRQFKFDFQYQYRYLCFHFRSNFSSGNFKTLSFEDRNQEVDSTNMAQTVDISFKETLVLQAFEDNILNEEEAFLVLELAACMHYCRDYCNRLEYVKLACLCISTKQQTRILLSEYTD